MISTDDPQNEVDKQFDEVVVAAANAVKQAKKKFEETYQQTAEAALNVITQAKHNFDSNFEFAQLSFGQNAADLHNSLLDVIKQKGDKLLEEAKKKATSDDTKNEIDKQFDQVLATASQVIEEAKQMFDLTYRKTSDAADKAIEEAKEKFDRDYELAKESFSKNASELQKNLDLLKQRGEELLEEAKARPTPLEAWKPFEYTITPRSKSANEANLDETFQVSSEAPHKTITQWQAKSNDGATVPPIVQKNIKALKQIGVEKAKEKEKANYTIKKQLEDASAVAGKMMQETENDIKKALQKAKHEADKALREAKKSAQTAYAETKKSVKYY